MKIAILSDVHGNEIALDAVLNDMPPVDDIICLGDTIGYGPRPTECVERVREHASTILQGNHETYLHNPEHCAGNHMAYAGINHARSELSDEQFEWVASLSPQQHLYDNRMLAVHGWPDPETPFRYIRRSNVTELIPYFKNTELDVITAGHLHVQFKQDLSKFNDDAGLFFNPGSVGQPRDGNPDAAYAILHLDETPAVDLRRVEYDVQAVIDQIDVAGLPDDTGARLINGKLSR